MITAIVTGAGGFIGRHVVRQAMRLGWNVHAVVSPNDQRSGIEGATLHGIDLTERTAIHALRRLEANVLIHLAAVTPPASENQVGFDRNIAMAETIRSAARAVRMRVVVAGSSAEYGNSGRSIDEHVELHPVTRYGAAKALITRSLLAETEAGVVDAVVLRPFIVYGPGQRAGMFVPDLIAACVRRVPFDMTAGEQRRDFVYVEDAARAFLLAATASLAHERVINVASGNPARLLDVAHHVAALCGASDSLRVGARPYRDGEGMELSGSTSLAATALHWRALTPLDVGLEQTVVAARGGDAGTLATV